MSKKAFTSKDLIEAFDITNREQAYMIDRGYLVADIKADKPRVFSQQQAINAGLIRFFQDHGLVLERATRIARITTSGFFAFYKMQDQFYHEPLVVLRVRDGIVCALTCTLFEEDGVVTHDFDTFFLATDKHDGEEDFKFSEDHVADSICTYNINSILTRFFTKLGIDKTQLDFTHPDKGIIVVVEGDKMYATLKEDMSE